MLCIFSLAMVHVEPFSSISIHLHVYNVHKISPELPAVPDHPFSVFEGAGALALLMMDLGTLHHKNSKSDESSTIKDARFPLYDF